MDRTIPPGWRHKHGAWYYRVPKSARPHWDNKQDFHLGKTLEQAWKEWDSRTALIPNDTGHATFGSLLTRYQRDILPGKKWKSQESNLISIARLLPVFGKMRLEHIKTHHVAQYRDRVATKHGRASANRDLEVLSHAYTKAEEWGLTNHRPTCKKLKNPPRDRYVEDWECAEALKVARPDLIAYIWLKLATGQRRSDLLALTLDDIRIDRPGIRFKPGKTSASSGRKVQIMWTHELLEWREFALSIRPETHDPHVFVNQKGAGWLDPKTGRANGFDTLWRRFIDTALEKTGLKVRFQEKDLRAKTASDTNLQHASSLLAHTSEQITQMVYRRKGEEVQPLDVSNLFTKLTTNS